jgi:hypothetical protein
MTGDDYSRNVLDALRSPPTTFDGVRIDHEGSRSASACMTQLLCRRLARSGESPRSRGRTTFDWNNGTVNIRNAAHRKYWTNIRMGFAKVFHEQAEDHATLYLLAWWNPLDSFIHVWAIPDHVVYAVLDYLPIGEDVEKRLVQVRPERHTFEKCENSPNLAPYYSKLDLADQEMAALTAVLENQLVPDPEDRRVIPDQVLKPFLVELRVVLQPDPFRLLVLQRGHGGLRSGGSVVVGRVPNRSPGGQPRPFDTDMLFRLCRALGVRPRPPLPDASQNDRCERGGTGSPSWGPTSPGDDLRGPHSGAD